MLAENWSKTADLGAQGGPDVLGAVRHEVFDTAHNVVEENVAVNEGAETGYLAGNGRPDFGLGILE